jgi:hypothetical protein
MEVAEQKRQVAMVYERLKNCTGCAVVVPNNDAGPEAESRSASA